MCSLWLSFSAFATVLCAVASSSYRRTSDGFSLSSSSPQFHDDFYSSNDGRLGNPVRQYVRTRRRIQGGPPIDFRPHDIFEIENPHFDSPRPKQNDDRRNARPIEQRNPAYSEIDGLRALPIRRQFEDERQEPKYTSGISQSSTNPTFQKLEPVQHQRVRPEMAYSLADGPQYTKSPDDTRPDSIVRYPGVPSTQFTNPGDVNDVSPTQYQEQPQAIKYHPHFSNPDSRHQQSGFSLVDENQQHSGLLQPEENKLTFEDRERSQTSPPQYEDFLQKQQEELQLYQRQNEEKQRKEQLDQHQQQYQPQNQQPQRAYVQPQRMNEQPQEQYQEPQRSYEEPQRQYEQQRSQQQQRSPLFYDEIRGIEQPPKNRDPDTTSHTKPHDYVAAVKASEERVVYKKHTPPQNTYNYKTKKPTPLQPVYSKDQPSFQNAGRPLSITGQLHENEVFDHLPEYQESFRRNSATSPAGESKEKRQALHGHAGGYDHNGLEFAAAASAAEHAHGKGGDGRLTFQLHGQKGPHSYRFGFDTGKGPHRQFRYEERDNDGTVKGRYGYYDSHGKLQMYNYSAHPEHGYEAAEAH